MTDKKDKNTKARSGRNEIDMLNGPLLSKIIIFALPLAATGMLQQLFNAADTAVVGRFSSSAAMAAVGSNSPIINLISSLFMGMSTGANVVIANAIGQRNDDRIRKAVHTSVLFSIICGLGMLILGQLIAEPLLRLVNVPSNVMPLALLYLRILFIGAPFMLFYNFCAAILRSKGDSRRPLYILLITGSINVILNLVLVVGFHHSVDGVAIATVVSDIVSAAIILRILLHEEGPLRISREYLHIDKKALRNIIMIGFPAGVQGMVFSLSNTVVQSGINSLGSNTIAGSSAGAIFEFICFFAINAFSQTATTFTSQNAGAHQYKRCNTTFSISIISSMIFCGALNLLIYIFKDPLLTIFTTDPAVAKQAVVRISCVLIFQWISSSYEISGAAMRGLGYSMTPAIVTIFGTCVLRIIWVYTVFKANPTFAMLLHVYPISWALTGAIMLIFYFSIRKKVYAEGIQLS